MGDKFVFIGDNCLATTIQPILLSRLKPSVKVCEMIAYEEIFCYPTRKLLMGSKITRPMNILVSYVTKKSLVQLFYIYESMHINWGENVILLGQPLFCDLTRSPQVDGAYTRNRVEFFVYLFYYCLYCLLVLDRK